MSETLQSSPLEARMVRQIIETLGSARRRKAMYLGTADVASAETFLNGFQVGCFACGLEVPLEIRERVTTARGWGWSAKRPIEEMRKRGWNEEEIVDELFAIEIAAWEAWSGSSGRFPPLSPHRSGRARFRHPAPRAMNSLRDQTDASQPRRGQRVMPLQVAEVLPRNPSLVRAATQPLVPGTPRVVPEATEAREIAGNPVIREMPSELRRQGLPLLLDRQMSVLAAPLHQRLQRPAEPVTGRLALHRPVPLQRPTPEVGEPQEVER